MDKPFLMEKDLIYRLALNRVKGVGPVYFKALMKHFGEAAEIFRAKPRDLLGIGGVRQPVALAISTFDEFDAAEQELAYINRHGIRCLFFTDPDYPQRILPYNTAPGLLFYFGNTDLNAARIISVVGTRTSTDYGRQAVHAFIRGIGIPDLVVVSGLAYGIDTAAHKAAVKYKLPTIGVLGHGLDRVYPAENRSLASEMVRHGGLLTRFCKGTEADECHFPLRNQTVAALCDALIVVETGPKGGSLLTISNALDYQKKIFAFPGRITDPQSVGCNALIRSGKAKLLTDPEDLLKEMHWDDSKPLQQELFPVPDESGLSVSERGILSLLRNKGALLMDELAAAQRIASGTAAMHLLNLELQGFLRSMPGNRYCLNT